MHALREYFTHANTIYQENKNDVIKMIMIKMVMHRIVHVPYVNVATTLICRCQVVVVDAFFLWSLSKSFNKPRILSDKHFINKFIDKNKLKSLLVEMLCTVRFSHEITGKLRAITTLFNHVVFPL